MFGFRGLAFKGLGFREVRRELMAALRGLSGLKLIGPRVLGSWVSRFGLVEYILEALSK